MNIQNIFLGAVCVTSSLFLSSRVILAAEQTTLKVPLTVNQSHGKVCVTAHAHDCKTNKARTVFESCTGLEGELVYTGYVLIADTDAKGTQITKPDGSVVACPSKTLKALVADIDDDAKGFHDGLREIAKSCLGGQ